MTAPPAPGQRDADASPGPEAPLLEGTLAAWCEPAKLALLLDRAGRGDESAFAALYDATSARTYGLAVRVLGDPVLAEGVLHDAYLEIWRRSGRLDATGGGPMAWILMIVHSKAVDRVRSGAVKPSRALLVRRHLAPRRDRTRVGPPDPVEVRRVRRLLAELTPRQSATLRQAYFGGHTHTEVDRLLGFAPGMSQLRIRESLARLRQLSEQG